MAVTPNSSTHHPLPEPSPSLQLPNSVPEPAPLHPSCTPPRAPARSLHPQSLAFIRFIYPIHNPFIITVQI
uniref:Uncharacterized protein n=1 Tax=Gopherus agassizii TaxID=38772 RepID=A0A452GZ06_9SAUR